MHTDGMPGPESPRDTMPILPLSIPIFVLGFIAFGVSELAPNVSPTVLLAQASAASGSSVNYEALDKQCLSNYSYDCKPPYFDTQTGEKCGLGLEVETSQVKGSCIQANLAHAEQYKNAQGQWEPASSGNSAQQTGSAAPGIVYNGSFYPIQTDQTLPSYQTSNLDTYGTYSSGYVVPSLSASQPDSYGQYFDGTNLPQVPQVSTVPSSPYSGAMFDETIGKWEGPGTMTGGSFNGPTNQLDLRGATSPLLEGQAAPPPQGTTFDDQGNVVTVPQSSQGYRFPMQEFTQPPSEDNAFSGTPNNPPVNPIPSEYQPQPGETFTPTSNGISNLYSNIPAPNTVSTFSQNSNPASGYSPTPSDPASGQGFFSSAATTMGNFFRSVFSKF